VFAPDAMSRTEVTRVGRVDVSPLSFVMTTTGTIGLSPLASTDDVIRDYDLARETSSPWLTLAVKPSP